MEAGSNATTPSNGASAPVQTTAAPVPGRADTPANDQPAIGSSPARGPDGKFLPRKSDGSAPAEIAQAMDAVEPKPVEEFRFKDKLKVFGEEQEVDYGREDLRRELQIAHAAKRRMEKIALREKEIAESERRAKEDPDYLAEHLRKLGADPEQFATRMLALKAKLASLTPEQQEIWRERQQREAAERQLAQMKAQQQAQQVREIVDRQWADLKPKIDAAVKAKGLPMTRPVVAMIGRVGYEFTEAGINADPADIAAEVHSRLMGESTSTVKNLPAETLMQILGDEKVNEILKTAVARWRASQQAAAAQPPRVDPGENETPTQNRDVLYPLDEREWDRRMRKG